MKKRNLFEIFLNILSDKDKELIQKYFKEFDSLCSLSKSDKNMMKKTFEEAIMLYYNNELEIEKILDLLALKNLGGFYSRPAQSWFRLDDAAKIYPVSMRHGEMSVFRLAITLKKEVIPELLQMALTFTIKRFPAFATTLKKGFFWHYLDSTKRCFVIQKEEDIPCQSLKVSESGSQSFRVLYFTNRVSVEFFHVLTDGSGALEFVKALINEYLRLTGVIINDQSNILDINENPNMEEYENEFQRVEKIPDSSGLINKIATQMTGELSRITPCRILHFKMNPIKLKEVARSYNLTISAYILSIMFIACKNASETYEGDFAIQVPVNMRKFYKTKTLRNFSMYCGIRLPINQINDIYSIKDEVVEQLKNKSTKEEMHKMAYSTKKLIKSIGFIPLIIKQPIAKFISGIVGEYAFTSTLSNLGVIELPNEFKEYIQDMEFTLNTSTINRASCGLITYNDVTTLSITKKTKDPSFENKLYELLTKDGIELIVEGSEIYEG